MQRMESQERQVTAGTEQVAEQGPIMNKSQTPSPGFSKRRKRSRWQRWMPLLEQLEQRLPLAAPSPLPDSPTGAAPFHGHTIDDAYGRLIMDDALPVVIESAAPQGSPGLVGAPVAPCGPGRVK